MEFDYVFSRSELAYPGSDIRELWQVTFEQMREAFTAQGIETEDLSHLDDQDFMAWSAISVFALARKPA